MIYEKITSKAEEMNHLFVILMLENDTVDK
jgi:hypothetical protein